MKRHVRIRIESKQAGQVQVQHATGELYDKNGSYYLRYAEPDPEMGKTTATVKWDDTHIKVIRHGDVSSELLFRSGTRTTGYYALPQGRMELELATIGIKKSMSEGLGTLSWSYDLYSGGAHVGRIKLGLTIEAE
ncbi:MAG: hypothetical protein K0Q59_3226 [Paenibacillus sp.]|nr:hypothetical protein [Paenibacillus sp.]